MFTPGTEKHYHHWVLNECSKQFETDYLQKNPFPQPGYCVTDNSVPDYWANIMQYCMKVSLVWAVGSSTIQDFPDDFAYPLGGSDNEFKYFYLEIHYDNPNHEPSNFIFAYILNHPQFPTDFLELNISSRNDYKHLV